VDERRWEKSLSEQAQAVRRPAYEGAGLGPAVTRKALHQTDGTIEVGIKKGEGSRCTVRLPLKQKETDIN
jgi:signal transduction histidine kinase